MSWLISDGQSIVYMGNSMCDINKYFDIYEDIKKLQPEDTLQLVLDARDDDEKAFFEMLGNYLLQKKQKEVIESNLF